MMSVHNMDICALTEVALKETTDTTCLGSRMVWKGFPRCGDKPESPWERGVGWAVRMGDHAPQIETVRWFGPRISTLTTKFKSIRTTFVAFYTPPANSKNRTMREEFLLHLRTVLQEAHGRIVLLGDSNAHLGWKHNDPRRPASSAWFADLLEETDMLLANHDTQLTARQKRTFTLSSALQTRFIRQRNLLLDVIVVSRKYRESVRAVRPVVMCLDSADHKLVRARFAPTWRNPRPAKPPPQATADPPTVDSVARRWQELVDGYTALTMQQRATPYRIPFATQEVKNAIVKKARAYATFKEARNTPTATVAEAAYITARQQAKTAVKKASEAYWKTWAEAVEDAINLGRTTEAFARLRQRYKPRPVKLPSGDLDGCVAHFKTVLGPQIPEGRDADQARWDKIPSPPRHEISDEEPTDEEVAKALAAMADTSPGPDGIGGKALRLLPTQIAALVRECWRSVTIPPAFRCAVLVALPKKSGATAWTDHRGITLLCVPSKVLARVMLNRLKVADLLDEQCGFRAHNSTADAIVAVKTVMDEASRCGVDAVFTFVDLAKAYDTIPRGVVWDTLKKLGAGEKMIRLLQEMYDDKIYVRSGKDKATVPFSSTQGVRQGCLLSPLLFNLVFDRVLRDLITRVPGIKFGDLTVRFRAYADDLVIISGTRAQAQKDIDAFQDACAIAGLTLSTSKTCYMQLDFARRRRMADAKAEPEPLPPFIKQTPHGSPYYVVPAGSHGAPCPYPGCARKAPTVSALNRHFESVHGIVVSVMNSEPILHKHKDFTLSEDKKEHKCNQCGACFSNFTAATRHANKLRHLVERYVFARTKIPLPKRRPSPDEINMDKMRELGLLPGSDEPDVITAREPSGARVPLQKVSRFTYLGRVLSADNDDKACVLPRIQAANMTAAAIFGRNRLKHASVATRLRTFHAIVRAQLVYSAETWTMTNAMRKQIDSFHMRWLRRLTGLLPYADSDRGHVMYPQNQKVVEAAKVKHMLSDEIDIQRLRFYGHTLRRDSAITQGLPLAGRTGFRAPDWTLRGQLRSLAAEVGLTDPLRDAQDRNVWRQAVATLRQNRHAGGTGSA